MRGHEKNSINYYFLDALRNHRGVKKINLMSWCFENLANLKTFQQLQKKWRFFLIYALIRAKHVFDIDMIFRHFFFWQLFWSLFNFDWFLANELHSFIFQTFLFFWHPCPLSFCTLLGTKIQQTKMLVRCQRFGDLFLFGLVWQYSSNHKTYNKGRFKVMAAYLQQ